MSAEKTNIRPYDGVRDERAVLTCIAELQDHERPREVEGLLPPGDTIAGAYLGYLLERGRACDGALLVAEVGGQVAGMINIWARIRPDSPDEHPSPYAYVSDLVVLPGFRRAGLGRRLLEAAEEYARRRGTRRLRIGVLPGNEPARGLYRSFGFRERQFELSKPIEAR